MKSILKGWLAPNTVSASEEEEMILLLESAGKLNFNQIIDAMHEQQTGLRRETIIHVVELYNRVLSDSLMSGYTVNTGLFNASPRFRGLIENGVWNEKKNSIYIDFQQDKLLYDAAKQVGVKILGLKQESAYILGSEDTSTRATDGTATAGRNLRLKGRKMKVVGDDPAVGLFIVDSSNNETKLTNDLLVQNKPSELIILLPADLADGDYELHIVTQFSSGNVWLKKPRTLTRQFTVGSGGEMEDPSA